MLPPAVLSTFLTTEELAVYCHVSSVEPVSLSAGQIAAHVRLATGSTRASLASLHGMGMLARRGDTYAVNSVATANIVFARLLMMQQAGTVAARCPTCQRTFDENDMAACILCSEGEHDVMCPDDGTALVFACDADVVTDASVDAAIASLRAMACAPPPSSGPRLPLNRSGVSGGSGDELLHRGLR